MPKFFNRRDYSDKKSLASAIDVNYKKQDDFVSSIYLGLKVCFSLLAIVSLIKLGYSSKVRINRLREINLSRELSNDEKIVYSRLGINPFIKLGKEYLSNN